MVNLFNCCVVKCWFEERNFLTGNQQSIVGPSKPSELFSFQYLTTIRKQWNCVNNICEESVTKCNKNVCNTIKNQFKSENYRPEVPAVETPQAFLNLPEFLNFPNFPVVEITQPFDNSGLIDLIANMKNFTYFYSNSKHINKKCQDNVCLITTKTCTNGKCDEKYVTE